MFRVRVVAVALVVLNGCGLFPSLSDLSACYEHDGGCPASSSAGSTGTGGAGTSSSSGTGAGGSSVCGASLHGPSMVRVPKGPAVPSAYCIDSLETTFDEYRVFMNDTTVDPTTLLPPLCAGYFDFTPKGNHWDKYNVPDAGDYGAHPVIGVSWC